MLQIHARRKKNDTVAIVLWMRVTCAKRREGKFEPGFAILSIYVRHIFCIGRGDGNARYPVSHFFFLSFFLKFHDYVLWLVFPFSIRSIFSIHVLGTGTRKEQWKYISHKMWNSRRNRKQWSRPIVWSFERFQWMMMANRWLMKKYDSAQFHRHIRHIQYRTISRRNKDIQSGDMKAIKKFLNLLR